LKVSATGATSHLNVFNGIELTDTIWGSTVFSSPELYGRWR
jgi:hypothetical protein